MAKTDIGATTLPPFYEKIERMSKGQKTLIYCLAFIILVALFVGLLYYPKYNELQKLSKELDKQKKELAVAKKNASQLDYYRKRLVEAEKEFKVAAAKLPEKQEIPSLLANVTKSGRDSGLEFILFQPMPMQKRDFYSEIPVSITVRGDYHNVAIFFDKVSRLSRIVNMQNIKMKPQIFETTGSKKMKAKGRSGLTQVSQEESLETNCQAVTYQFFEETIKPKVVAQ